MPHLYQSSVCANLGRFFFLINLVCCSYSMLPIPISMAGSFPCHCIIAVAVCKLATQGAWPHIITADMLDYYVKYHIPF